MRIALILLIVAMIAKDTSGLGDPYIMRGTTQAFCLLGGFTWLVYNGTPAMLLRYWPVAGYAGVISAGALFSSSPIFVLLQLVSIVAVSLFGIALAEQRKLTPVKFGNALITTTVVSYTVVMIGSLIVRIVAPNIAYETLFAGDLLGSEIRFRGLFSKSAMLAAAAGISLGCIWFGIRSVLLRVVFSLPALACLLFTQSRTFWIATLLALVVVTQLYVPARKRLMILVLAVFVAFGGLTALLVAGLDSSKLDQSASTLARTSSILSLSGRVQLWQKAWTGFLENPVLGYGLTLGAEGLSADSHGAAIYHEAKDREISRTSMHNGYLQSLLDSGLVGTFFYLSVIALAVQGFILYDSARQFPSECYVLVFMVIANISESVVYAASAYHSVLFWIVAVAGLSLRKASVGGATQFSSTWPGMPIDVGEAGVPAAAPLLTEFDPSGKMTKVSKNH